MKPRRFLHALFTFSTFIGAALFAGSALAAPLKIGVVPGIFADSVEVAAKEAKAQGLDIQVVEFTDWTTPNVALESGDIDLNYYQNSNYLANAVRSKGFNFVSVQPGILSYLGLYSTKHRSLADVPNGAKVAIASDPVNIGRALRLLQHAGLITLRPDTGLLGTQADIRSNPKNLQFIEIEGPQLVRATQDVDLAQGFPYFIIPSKAFDATRGLAYTSYEDDSWAIQFVARKDKAADPRIAQFLTIYQNSDAVRKAIHAFYLNDSKLYRLTWLKR
ncbi:metal ABC transporter substrate-binding protein [Acidovorax sp. SUPP1855]|uniref:MetQ/NlpA family ABC transporter substrate-binding protein n=1 Tax=unclassified Acidovorax TaxID=2684926 RepID=UPI0023DE42E8|nr:MULTISPECIES: MetQ/NlpA family ABC transporter substrate-binding protein [Comamonadaceae]WOI47980.1 MetQ/NlpA family ABC transporter substrate-binding protein [Paracidovorax avenae]GKS82980.1 metal ABC transporter substrate-binding protein [Acidovorax sp. SUPP1855]GKT00706.1 metal ABC transporter substrate-binding protein [Acidovorax sp. SUPP3434]